MNEIPSSFDDEACDKVKKRPSFVLMAGMLTGFIWFDQALQTSLKERGYEPVSRSESQVLVMAGTGLTRPSDISKALGLSRQAVNLTLKKLVERKLLKLIPDPKDGRSLLVLPSPEGWEMVKSAVDILDLSETHLSQKIGAETLHNVVEAVAKDWGQTPLFP